MPQRELGGGARAVPVAAPRPLEDAFELSQANLARAVEIHKVEKLLDDLRARTCQKGARVKRRHVSKGG
eukprot:5519565-Prymnesium_polylepis.2